MEIRPPVIRELPEIKVVGLLGVKYREPRDIPHVEPREPIDTKTFTVNDCMSRPIDVLEGHLDTYPATQSMLNNIQIAAAFVKVLIPESQQNVDNAAAITQRTQATLNYIKEVEKTLSASWWDRKYLWWLGIACTKSLIVYMVVTKATPILAGSAAVDLLKTTMSVSKETVKSTTKKVTENVTPENTLNIFLDNPLTCLAIVGLTAFSVLGIRGSIRTVSWIVTKLK
jgi:hypothetical protein